MEDRNIELEKVADFLEPHWRGAGVKLSADWLTSEIKATVESLEHECEASMSEIATGRERAEKAEAELTALRWAARDVLAYRVGELPAKGWLKDNDASRAALERLAQAI